MFFRESLVNAQRYVHKMFRASENSKRFHEGKVFICKVYSQESKPSNKFVTYHWLILKNLAISRHSLLCLYGLSIKMVKRALPVKQCYIDLNMLSCFKDLKYV